MGLDAIWYNTAAGGIVGIMDFFGGNGPEKAQKLKAKVLQKYGDPSTRQKALSQLGEMDIPEAVAALMARFTVTVEPMTTDADEKEHVFDLLRGRGEKALEPILDFLRKSDQASSWAVRLLTAIAPEPQVTGMLVEYLEKLGQQYTRDPGKKLVMIQAVEGRTDPRIGPAILPFLEDMSDDVKIAALKVLGPLKLEAARELMLKLLTTPETAKRVQTAAIAALTESEFGVQGYREKVEGLLSEPYFVDKSGLLKKRGAATAHP